MRKSTRIKKKIIKSKVNIISISECCETIVNWSNQKKTKYISIADTHVVALSWLDSKYRKIVNSSDICTPDGAPLAWVLRSYGFKNQKRVSGPDLIEKLIPFLEKYKLRVLFYGSSEKVLLKNRN